MNVTIKTQTQEYITFDVESESRNGLNHEVVFNRVTGEFSCRCEDFFYRKRECKHIRACKNFINELMIEMISSHEIFTGETLTTEEITDGVQVI